MSSIRMIPRAGGLPADPRVAGPKRSLRVWDGLHAGVSDPCLEGSFGPGQVHTPGELPRKTGRGDGCRCPDTPLERLTLRDDLLMRCQAISAGPGTLRVGHSWPNRRRPHLLARVR
jgi:hypothetical protein